MAADWEADRKVLSRVQDSKLWNRDGPNLGVHKQICKICVQGIEHNWYTISILCSSFSLKFKCGLWKQKIQITNFVRSFKHKVMLYNLGLLFKYLHNWNQPSHIRIPKRRLESTNDFRGTLSKTNAFLIWIPGLQLLVTNMMWRSNKTCKELICGDLSFNVGSNPGWIVKESKRKHKRIKQTVKKI